MNSKKAKLFGIVAYIVGAFFVNAHCRMNRWDDWSGATEARKNQELLGETTKAINAMASMPKSYNGLQLVSMLEGSYDKLSMKATRRELYSSHDEMSAGISTTAATAFWPVYLASECTYKLMENLPSVEIRRSETSQLPSPEPPQTEDIFSQDAPKVPTLAPSLTSIVEKGPSENEQQ